jgi:hypothetical protein
MPKYPSNIINDLIPLHLIKKKKAFILVILLVAINPGEKRQKIMLKELAIHA